MSRPINIGKRRFGMLVAIKQDGKDNHGRFMWRCVCDCGQESRVMVGNLTSGNSTSCGCQKHRKTHGKRHLRAYGIWAHVLSRCTNPNNDAFQHYGGRGITVCERWKSFENFLEDMGDAPAGLSIDRINNDRGYEPGNCRWATTREQMRNTRRNHLVAYKGETKCLTEWAEQNGMCPSVLRGRIVDYRWPMERALSTPIRSTLATISTKDSR